jgi:hypothetical protein
MCSSCSRNLGFKRPDLKIWKNVVMEYFNAPSLDLTRGGKKIYISLAFVVHTRSENASLTVSFLLNNHDIPSVYSSGIQLCVGFWIYTIQNSVPYTRGTPQKKD